MITQTRFHLNFTPRSPAAREPVQATPRPSVGEMTDLYAYLRVAMGPQSVPILWVSLPSICGSDDGGNSWGPLFRFPIGPLLGSTNWHRLRFARFEHLKIRLLDLEKLMGML